MPDMNMMMAMAQAVGADPNDGDMVMMPANPQLISVVYAGGDPHFAQAPGPHGFCHSRVGFGGDTRMTIEDDCLDNYQGVGVGKTVPCRQSFWNAGRYFFWRPGPFHGNGDGAATQDAVPEAYMVQNTAGYERSKAGEYKAFADRL
ncbi:MAG: hypothetical protein M0C28_30575 [Candidatus Moduliflexus flocculans]|nr:hypothetical protein [Candidatus Moduliflexus flocculans]